MEATKYFNNKEIMQDNEQSEDKEDTDLGFLPSRMKQKAWRSSALFNSHQVGQGIDDRVTSLFRTPAILVSQTVQQSILYGGIALWS